MPGQKQQLACRALAALRAVCTAVVTVATASLTFTAERGAERRAPVPGRRRVAQWAHGSALAALRAVCTAGLVPSRKPRFFPCPVPRACQRLRSVGLNKFGMRHSGVIQPLSLPWSQIISPVTRADTKSSSNHSEYTLSMVDAIGFLLAAREELACFSLLCSHTRCRSSIS